MPFHELRLIEPLLNAIRSEGYTIPTDIQKQAIPHVLEGKDLLGCAQTGTGKTAAFALPILQLLSQRVASPRPAAGGGHDAHKPGGSHAAGHRPAAPAVSQHRPIRVLVLTPTRELAAQIGESFRVYGQHVPLRHTVIFGGVGQKPQEQALRRGVDILVATPGRLLDLLNQRLLSLSNVEIFVLDEADRMLDMGFIHDIRRVIALLPARRQTLLFSATMPREIRSLAATLLRQPVEVHIAAESPAADTVQQALYFIEQAGKYDLLEQLLQSPQTTRTLVFTRTKRGADRVAKRLAGAQVVAEAIHSNKSQNARLRALDNFKKGKTRVLVASDIASRGLDVDDISHVINFDLPREAHTYVHRIGRTGRAGAQGKAISFCSGEERGQLRDIEKLLGKNIPVLHHTIKVSPQAAAESQEHRSHRGHAPAAGRSTSYSHHKPRSPQQQKNDFWRRKRPRR